MTSPPPQQAFATLPVGFLACILACAAATEECLDIPSGASEQATRAQHAVLMQVKSSYQEGVLISERGSLFPSLREDETSWEANYIHDTNDPLSQEFGSRGLNQVDYRASLASALRGSREAGMAAGGGVVLAAAAQPEALHAPRTESSTQDDWAWNPNWGTRADGLPTDEWASDPNWGNRDTETAAAAIGEAQPQGASPSAAHEPPPLPQAAQPQGIPMAEAPINNMACVTRSDPRATSYGPSTAPEGSPCVFGVDDRDEGYHCIPDGGLYGSFGWCWATSFKTSWGSCDRGCPLFGPDQVLQAGMDSLQRDVNEILARERTIEASEEALAASAEAIANSTEAIVRPIPIIASPFEASA